MVATDLAVAFALGGSLSEIEAFEDGVLAKFLFDFHYGFLPALLAAEIAMALGLDVEPEVVVGEEVELALWHGGWKEWRCRSEIVERQGDAPDKERRVHDAVEEGLHGLDHS